MNKTVLIVEDDPKNLKLSRDLLQSQWIWADALPRFSACASDTDSWTKSSFESTLLMAEWRLLPH